MFTIQTDGDVKLLKNAIGMEFRENVPMYSK
jgi:hypothetical protein